MASRRRPAQATGSRPRRQAHAEIFAHHADFAEATADQRGTPTSSEISSSAMTCELSFSSSPSSSPSGVS